MKFVVLFVVLSVGAAFAPASSLPYHVSGRTQFELTPLEAWQGLATGSAQDTSSFFPDDDCCREGVEADGSSPAAAAFAIAPEPAGGFILVAGLILIGLLKGAGASGEFPDRKPRRR